MNITSHLYSKPGSFLGKMLSASLFVWMLGVVFTPALAATAVTVDQQPLIIQKPLAPNVTLMLDDSGSMAWDYMPDICYLNGVVCDGNGNFTSANNDALINSNNNGTYFNPSVTYSPPPKADGTFYNASPSLTGAYKDLIRPDPQPAVA